MNYSIIQLAREELGDYEEEYQGLVKKINLSLFTLPETNLESNKKKKVWSELLEYTKNIIGKAEKFLDRLDSTNFSEDELVLEEERKNLVQKYNILINNLQKEKETILRQVEKAIVVVTPLRKKVPRLGYCYFCDIDITAGFAYKLREEEQKVLGVETPEGAEFCSQECLLDHCKEYKNREKMRQEEEKKHREKIESDRKLVTTIQEEITEMTKKINSLESKERELELSSDRYQIKESPGFFRRLGQKIGIIKKDSAVSSLEEIRKEKSELKTKLERNEEKLQKALVILSIDKQIEQKRKKAGEKLSYQKREKIATKNQEENED